MGGFGIDWYINVTNNACFSQNQLTVSMGNPKIHILQNCKVKLVYLREQLKARVKLLYVKESLDFICLRRLCSVSFSYRTCHVRIQRIGQAKTQTTRAVYRPCRLSIFFFALVCPLNFDSLFFGSSYKIVFNIFKFVIYPQAAEAQY